MPSSYRILDGAVHYTGSTVYTCSLGHGDCYSGDSYDVGSLRRERSTDVQFSVHAPGEPSGGGINRAVLDIDAWTHAYSERTSFSRIPVWHAYHTNGHGLRPAA